jgi:NHL repeat
MPRTRVCLLLATIFMLTGAVATSAANPASKRCRSSCKRVKTACKGQVKKDLVVLLGNCTGGTLARRSCRRQARGSARAARGICTIAARTCRSCCAGGETDCVPTTTTTTGSTTTTTIPASPPSAPAIAFLAATAPDEMRVVWRPAHDDTTPPSAIRYEVHVATVPAFDPTPATLRASTTGFQPGDEPHAVVGGLMPGSSVHVVVVALDDADQRSAVGSARSLTLPTLPVILSPTTPLQTAAALALGEPVVSGSTYTYVVGAGTTAPSVGAVLFGLRQGKPYLRRVDTVTALGGKIIIETSDASLSDAVAQMAVASTHVLVDEDGPAASAVRVGDAPARPTARSRGTAVSSDVGVDTMVDFEPELRTHATWTTDLLDGVTLTQAEVVARGTLALSLDAHYRFLAAGGVNRTIPFPVLTRTYTSVYTVGAVPVHQQIVFTLDAEVSASAAAAIDATARAAATATVEFGVRYNPATEGWDDVASAIFTPTFTADLVSKGKVTGQVRLIPRIQVKFYDVVSAHLSIEPALRTEIETQATTRPPCAPAELSKFDVALVVEPFVSADFRALARNVSLFDRTRVGGPFTFALFDLPQVQASSQARGPGMASLLAAVTDGTNHPFDPASSRWDLSPATATIDPTTGSTLALLTCAQPATYHVVFSGHGVLGEAARRCTAIDVPCQPSSTTTTGSTSSTTSTSSQPGSTTTSTSTTTTTTAPPGEPCGTFLTGWGTSGNGPGQFIGPRGVAIDRRNGNVYTTDGGSNRVQWFDRNGVYLGQWGTTGTGEGGFMGVLGIAVTANGLVYVVDANAHRINKFDASGTFLSRWGTEGTGDGQFKSPIGIAVDGGGNVYVADKDNARVQKFDGNGGFLAKWGTSGGLDGDFGTLLGVATDALGNVYTIEQSGRRVQKFSATGTFLAKWGTNGSGDGQFNAPYALATDGVGTVFVMDPFRGDVQRFSGTGTFLGKWGSLGNGNAQFQFGIGIASDGDGKIYVADRDQKRIKKFSCP